MSTFGRREAQAQAGIADAYRYGDQARHLHGRPKRVLMTTAPSPSTPRLPFALVVIWIYGGSFRPL